MLPRPIALARTALVAGLLVTIALPASASPETTPEFRFPQEIDQTEFHSSFGHARSGGRRHRGNDLMAPKMTEVYAIADGVVKIIRSSSLGGRYLAIDHGSGWESYYMHLNNDYPGTDSGGADWSYTIAPGVEERSVVTAGQLIAWVGDSGNAEWTGPHTHFELHFNGRAINPYPHLIAAMERDAVAQALDQRLEEITERKRLLKEFRELGYPVR
jgi:murein DD-endopeptidase MepM/ murein hydrolase activator NlpD